MQLTEQQIRATVAKMTADEQTRGIKHAKAQLKGRQLLMERAIAGDPNAGFVVFTNWRRQQEASPFHVGENCPCGQHASK